MSHPNVSTPVLPVQSLFARLRQNSWPCLLILPTVIAFVLFLCVLVNADARSLATSLEQPTLTVRSAPLSANATVVTPTFTAQYFGGPKNTTSVAVGDLNGDGALDIVQGNSGEPSIVYWNDGAGGFVAGPQLSGVYSKTTSIAVGDLNGDGALDIVQGNSDGASVVYWNDGKGGFTRTIELTGSTKSVAVGDLNGDGVLDIVLSNPSWSLSVVYWNDGKGSLAVTSTLGEQGGSVAVGDLDGDGVLDIAVVNTWGLVVYWNDGKGKFTASDPRSIPFCSYLTSIAVGDLDGNGTLDIVAGANSLPLWPMSNSAPNCMFWNKGRREFTRTFLSVQKAI